MYDKFDTLADAAERYKRHRRPQHFILADESPDLALPCGSCGRPLTEYAPDVDDTNARGYHGNRGHYYPRDRVFVLQHYTCAWGNLLGAVCVSHTVAEAAQRLAASERRMARRAS